MATANLMPSDSGLLPANSEHSSTSERLIFRSKSDPMFPVPIIAVLIFFIYKLFSAFVQSRFKHTAGEIHEGAALLCGGGASPRFMRSRSMTSGRRRT